MSSNVPKGDQQVDMGSSMLMPGFSFEDDYGEGVLDGARLPSVPGYSQLPTHITQSETKALAPDVQFKDAFYVADGMSLPLEMGKQASHLVDLSWMDAGTFQVTDQEPMLQQLERAWSARTDGVHRTEAYESPRLPTMREVAEMPEVVRTAMRRSASGHPFKKVAQEVLEAVGDSKFREAVPALKSIQDEEGLHGRVYLRASAFSGINSSQVRDQYPDVRYMIACGQCFSCQQGASTKCAAAQSSGLKIVASVPWREAYQHYMTRLDLQPFAQKAASARDSIRKTFLAKESHVEETRVALEMPKEHCRVQDVADIPEVKVKTAQGLAQDKANAFLSKWQQQGKLSGRQVEQLRKLAHKDMYEAASAIIMGVQKHDYQGDVVTGLSTRSLTAAELQQGLAGLQSKPQAEIRTAGATELLKAAAASVKAGASPQELRQRLAGYLPETVREVYSQLEVLFKKADANAQRRIQPVESKVQNPVANYSNTASLKAPTLDVSVGTVLQQELNVFGLASGMVLE